jgi:hypothetical protein
MLDDGTIIGCRYCSQCVGRSVDDWTGRCIAESIFAVAPYFLSLTYGRDENGSEDHIRARLLTYSDIQKLMKRFRASGYHPRYFCVGEYGSAKGRAHWHVLIFWRDNSAEIAKRIEHNEMVRAKLKRGKTLNVPEGPVPPHQPSTRDNQVRHMQEHWPAGFSTWEKLGVKPEDTAAAVRYVCKYLNKDIGGEEKQAICRMSKVPLLGADWLHHRAALHVEAGFSPRDLKYEFPGVNRSNGQRVQFMLRPGSAAAKLFCQSFVDQWAEAYPGVHVPPGEMIEEFTSPGAWEKRKADEGQFQWERKAEAREKAVLASEVARAVSVGPLRWPQYQRDAMRSQSPSQSPSAQPDVPFGGL